MIVVDKQCALSSVPPLISRCGHRVNNHNHSHMALHWLSDISTSVKLSNYLRLLAFSPELFSVTESSKGKHRL